MKTTILSLLGVLLFAWGNGQTFEWALGQGSTDWDQSDILTIDASGNVYVAGFFRGSVDFDPSSSTDIRTSNGASDIYVQKLNSNGELIWVRTIGGNNSDAVVGLEIDANGDLLLAGAFQETVNFNPIGSPAAPLTAFGSHDVFVMKMDANGNFIWVKQYGGTGSDYPNDLKIVPGGSLMVTGRFFNNADFDPTAGTSYLTSNGSGDIFLARLTADGDLMWAHGVGSTGSDFSTAMAIDPQGNSYTCGYYNGTVDFDPSAATLNLTSNGSNDYFVQKFDSSGNLQWAHSFGSTALDWANDLVLGSDGMLYLTGIYAGTVDFDPSTTGSFNLTSNGSNDIFVQKLDLDGNFQWAVGTGGPNEDESEGIAADAYGNVYATGYFNGSPDFDPGAGVLQLNSTGGDDIFVWKLDLSGNLVDAFNLGGSANEMGRALAIDGSNNLYLGGLFRSSVDFDPSANTFSISSNGNADAFVVKFSQSIPLSADKIVLEGNVLSGEVLLHWTSSLEENSRYAVERSENGLNWNTLAVVAHQNSSSYSYTDQSLRQGLSHYRIRQTTLSGQELISNQVLISEELNAAQSLICFPNPTQNLLTVHGNEDLAVQLRIFNLLGEEVSQNTSRVVHNNRQVTLDLSQLPQGAYLLRAGKFSQRVIKR